MILKMLSLGVISEEKISELLAKGFELAEKSAERGDARGYSACMKIAMEAAKLEQNERKADKPAANIGDTFNTVILDGNSGTLDERRTQLLGLIDQLRDRSGAVDDPSVIDAAHDAEPSIPKEPEN